MKLYLTQNEHELLSSIRSFIKSNNLQVVPRVAGGWVRDKLLKIQSSDVDIVLDTYSGKKFANLYKDYMNKEKTNISKIGIIKENPEQSKHIETAALIVFDIHVDFLQQRTEKYDNKIKSKSDSIENKTIENLLNNNLQDKKLNLKESKYNKDKLDNNLQAKKFYSLESKNDIFNLQDKKLNVKESKNDIFNLQDKKLNLKESKNDIFDLQDKKLNVKESKNDLSNLQEKKLNLKKSKNNSFDLQEKKLNSIESEINIEKKHIINNEKNNYLYEETESINSTSSRIPNIKPGCLTEDALRRDITINTLYYNILEKRIEDVTGNGFNDLTNGTIKTPLDPFQTFLDDPLRILRVLRFASRFGYKIEENIKLAMKEKEIKEAFENKVSKERVGCEVFKILKMVDGMKMIFDCGLCDIVFYDFENYNISLDSKEKYFKKENDNINKVIIKKDDIEKDHFNYHDNKKILITNSNVKKENINNNYINIEYKEKMGNYFINLKDYMQEKGIKVQKKINCDIKENDVIDLNTNFYNISDENILKEKKTIKIIEMTEKIIEGNFDDFFKNKNNNLINEDKNDDLIILNLYAYLYFTVEFKKQKESLNCYIVKNHLKSTTKFYKKIKKIDENITFLKKNYFDFLNDNDKIKKFNTIKNIRLMGEEWKISFLILIFHNENRDIYKSILKYIKNNKLEKVYEIKPIFNGKEISSRFNVKNEKIAIYIEYGVCLQIAYDLKNIDDIFKMIDLHVNDIK